MVDNIQNDASFQTEDSFREHVSDVLDQAFAIAKSPNLVPGSTMEQLAKQQVIDALRDALQTGMAEYLKRPERENWIEVHTIDRIEHLPQDGFDIWVYLSNGLHIPLCRSTLGSGVLPEDVSKDTHLAVMRVQLIDTVRDDPYFRDPVIVCADEETVAQWREFDRSVNEDRFR